MSSDAGTGTGTGRSSPHPTGEWLSAYTDAELGPGPRASIERHLRACGRCTREVLGYREVGRVLRRVPPQPLPRPLLPVRGRALPWERTAATGTWAPTAPDSTCLWAETLGSADAVAEARRRGGAEARGRGGAGARPDRLGARRRGG